MKIPHFTTAIILFAFHLIHASGFKNFTGINDTLAKPLVTYLEKSGLGKVTYFFDNEKQKDGQWHFYPSAQISNIIVAVNISTIPNRSSDYTFVILVDTTSWSITDTLGPFYDSYVDAISPKLKNNRIEEIKIRLNNPPEPNESRFTIIEYIRKNSKLTKTKSYDKN
jgi:hypothetical protein